MSQKPMIKSRLFKLPEHKRFSFPARYYNEDKERLEQRIKDIKTGNYKSNIKDFISFSYQESSIGECQPTFLFLLFIESGRYPSKESLNGALL